MSALCTALDTEITNLKIGENNNMEYTWSNDINELLLQFSYQLTRTTCTKELEDKYKNILKLIFNNSNRSNELDNIKIIYKLIGYTRDIVSGKGEYNLTYMLISELYNFSQCKNCPEKDKYRIQTMSTSAIESLVRTNIDEHPYGSWKDMKYLCNYIIKKEDRYDYILNTIKNPLFEQIINLFCSQIRSDEHSPKKSLAARWVPREKSSKFGWITPILAMRYYESWMRLNNSENTLLTTEHRQYKLARRKCLTHFRQLIAKINKELNTPQINQCNGTWSDIDFDKNVSGITLRKQSKAFQSIKTEKEDRIKCAENYKEYIERCKTGKTEAKGKRVSIIDFVKAAINIENQQFNMDPAILEEYRIEKDSINVQWENNAKQNKQLEDCIAMVDTSGSMEDENCNPLYSAIGLGIRIAEKSKFGKRVLTFSANPSWVNFDDCNDFVSMVHKIRKSQWGTNTNFRKALDAILNVAIANNINPHDMKKTTLVILSDMQIDCAESNSVNNEPMFDMMKKKYHDAGLRTIYKKPYELPHIIFWNLNKTNGFPSMSTTENTSMMSGNNPVLLNSFCTDGINMLQEITPWKMLLKQLSNKRYDHLENIVKNLWKY